MEYVTYVFIKGNRLFSPHRSTVSFISKQNLYGWTASELQSFEEEKSLHLNHWYISMVWDVKYIILIKKQY